MSFRGGPLVTGDLSEHAYRAVRAALDSTKALAALDDPYFKRVKIGGASADDCMIGAFGTSARLSYTILGDGVNLAARLEPASGQCGTQNLFCEITYRLCAPHPDLIWRRWGRIRVVGKSEPIAVFEAFDTVDIGDPLFITTYHRAPRSLRAERLRTRPRPLPPCRPATSRRRRAEPVLCRVVPAAPYCAVSRWAGSRCLTRTNSAVALRRQHSRQGPGNRPSPTGFLARNKGTYKE